VARGHEVTILHINKNKPFWQTGLDQRENGYRYVEIPCRVFPKKSWRGRLIASHLAALLVLWFRRGKKLPRFDVMEAFSQGGFPFFYIRCMANGTFPVMVRVSTTGTQMQGLKVQGKRIYGNWLENKLIQSARHLCTHTKAHRDEICAALAIKPKRMTVIPHGIALSTLPLRSAVPEKFVLIAGRFEERKGTDIALAAVPLVLEKQSDCRFIFAGGGDKAELWTRRFLTEHPSFSGRVDFLGRVSNEKLDELYQACEFFVSPARYESFGLAYLEAMRYGKPVVGCLKSGGAEEVIGDGGLLVRQDDPADLAEAILRLWNDPGLRQELSAHARLRAGHFSIERQAELTEQHFAGMIAADRPPPVAWVTWAILSSSVAIFLYQLRLDRTRGYDIVGNALAFSPEALADHRYWTLITYAWVHAVAMFGYSSLFWLHLAANMTFLYCLGPAMETCLGHRRYLGLYLGGVIASALFWYLFTSAADFDQRIIGASGAIFTLIAGAATVAPRELVDVYVVLVFPINLVLWQLSRLARTVRRRMRKPINRKLWTMALVIQRMRLWLRRPFKIKLWIIALVICLLEVLQMVFGWFPQIAHSAHLGGALFGFLYVIILRLWASRSAVHH